jgi:hypothetical protein
MVHSIAHGCRLGGVWNAAVLKVREAHRLINVVKLFILLVPVVMLARLRGTSCEYADMVQETQGGM